MIQLYMTVLEDFMGHIFNERFWFLPMQYRNQYGQDLISGTGTSAYSLESIEFLLL